ncbi:hypothetical protein OPT61_g2492 [Boeremia exigua]|uniref:Uncharacterized protein n=1 Tax=Boeremia exigua TaxID=749465 RepID=A0ACC2ILA0_9PLEO|nr:hypothetical protein OPT61_g2492 [Boeremia exigua]
MWLLGTTTLELYDFLTDVPDYVILSHTWGPEEVSFDDIKDPQLRRTLKGFDKILGCCQQALQDGFEWVWIDTCCIDKRSSAELSEAINSMYEWYWRAAKCYAYLSDAPEQRPFMKSVWFERGWTLQELLAPATVEFFDHEWNFMGTKLSLSNNIQEATGIHRTFIFDRHTIQDASVATKFSWASKRVTTRTEDVAYCLLGLMGVNMPMLYGEGGNAFIRLQLELLKNSNDHTIFAWGAFEKAHLDAAEFRATTTVLAPSPACFRYSAGFRTTFADRSDRSLTHEITNNGLRICLPCVDKPGNGHESTSLAWLYCKDAQGRIIGIELKKTLLTGCYLRPNKQLYTRPTGPSNKLGKLVDMYLQISDRDWFTQKYEQLRGETASLRVSRIHTYRGCYVQVVSLSSEHDVSTDKDLVEASATLTVDANYIVNELIVPDDKVASLRILSPRVPDKEHLVMLGVHRSQPIIHTIARMYSNQNSTSKNWYKALGETPNRRDGYVRDYARVGDGSFQHIIQAKVMKEGTRLTWSVTITAADEADRHDYYGKFGLSSKEKHQENNLACFCLDCRFQRLRASLVNRPASLSTLSLEVQRSELATMHRQQQKQRRDDATDHVVECTCPICAKESRIEVRVIR